MKIPQVGDVVRVKGFRQHATIIASYEPKPGKKWDNSVHVKGGIRLDKEVGGFFSWNVKDLVLIKARKPQ